MGDSKMEYGFVKFFDKDNDKMAENFFRPSNNNDPLGFRSMNNTLSRILFPFGNTLMPNLEYFYYLNAIYHNVVQEEENPKKKDPTKEEIRRINDIERKISAVLQTIKKGKGFYGTRVGDSERAYIRYKNIMETMHYMKKDWKPEKGEDRVSWIRSEEPLQNWLEKTTRYEAVKKICEKYKDNDYNLGEADIKEILDEAIVKRTCNKYGDYLEDKEIKEIKEICQKIKDNKKYLVDVDKDNKKYLVDVIKIIDEKAVEKICEKCEDNEEGIQKIKEICQKNIDYKKDLKSKDIIDEDIIIDLGYEDIIKIIDEEVVKMICEKCKANLEDENIKKEIDKKIVKKIYDEYKVDKVKLIVEGIKREIGEEKVKEIYEKYKDNKGNLGDKDIKDKVKEICKEHDFDEDKKYKWVVEGIKRRIDKESKYNYEWLYNLEPLEKLDFVCRVIQRYKYKVDANCSLFANIVMYYLEYDKFFIVSDAEDANEKAREYFKRKEKVSKFPKFNEIGKDILDPLYDKWKIGYFREDLLQNEVYYIAERYSALQYIAKIVYNMCLYSDDDVHEDHKSTNKDEVKKADKPTYKDVVEREIKGYIDGYKEIKPNFYGDLDKMQKKISYDNEHGQNGQNELKDIFDFVNNIHQAIKKYADEKEKEKTFNECIQDIKERVKEREIKILGEDARIDSGLNLKTISEYRDTFRWEYRPEDEKNEKIEMDNSQEDEETGNNSDGEVRDDEETTGQDNNSQQSGSTPKTKSVQYYMWELFGKEDDDDKKSNNEGEA